MKKVLVAMSGGVDSAASAYLMKNRGYDAVGATMKLIDPAIATSACCTKRDIADARAVAERIGIPYHVYDFSSRFQECVINPFIHAYETGCTPNPCICCNRHLKFESLYEKAAQLGCDAIATGHYARIEQDSKSGRYLLKKAPDATKDQSYVLYSLSQEQLSRTLFPVGNLPKTAVRDLAEKAGLSVAEKQESQDICFVKGETYIEFIERTTGKHYPEGNFIDKNGKILGRHRGIIRYTVGQHKKLGISTSVPLYVLRVLPETNEVMLGEESDLFTTEVRACHLNFSAIDTVSEPLRVKAKIRYRHTEEWATAYMEDDGILHLSFDIPQRAVTPGQSVVLYDGDTVLGGGIIM